MCTVSGCLHISDEHYATNIATVSDVHIMKVSESKVNNEGSVYSIFLANEIA